MCHLRRTGVIRGWSWDLFTFEPSYAVATSSIAAHGSSGWHAADTSYMIDANERDIVPICYPRSPAPWPLTVSKTWDFVDSTISAIRDVGKKFSSVQVNRIGMIWFVPGIELLEEFPDDYDYGHAALESGKQI